MPVSKAQQKAVNNFIRKNYDRIGVTVPKGLKESIEHRARENGYTSVNAYINNLIREDMGITQEEWKKAGE